MKNLRTITAILFLALLAACSSSSTRPVPEGLQDSGTITVREQNVLRLAAGGTGQGTLIFQSWQHPFSVENATLSGIGGKAIELDGTVYNLSEIADFEGVYKPTRVDFQAGEGLRGLWVENEKGVVIYFRTKGEDVTMQVNPTGAVVKLIEQ